MQNDEIRVVNLLEQFGKVNEYWSPAIVGELNESFIKVARIKGEFVWHHHMEEDEMFFVVYGKLKIKLPDRDLIINEGEFTIIPKGTEHLPIAEEEVLLLLIEPKTTLNTGNVQNERTKQELDWL